MRETGTNVDYTTVSHNTVSGTSNHNQPSFVGAHSTFDPSPADHPPVAQPDSFNDSFNATLTGNVLADNGHGADSDPDGDHLSVTAFNGQTAHGGTLSLHADGSFTYTPKSGFTGSDGFNYTLLDGRGGTATGAVSITVAATVTNHPPIANPDNFNDPFNTTLSGNVLADNGHGKDSDPDGDALSVTAFNSQTAGGGVLAPHTDGTFSYTPQFGFAGSDSFNYTLLDGHGGTASGVVSIAVAPPPGASSAQTEMTIYPERAATTLFSV